MKQKINPKSVPRNCHQCDREFKVRERTNFKFQRKSIAIIVGAFISYFIAYAYVAETTPTKEFYEILWGNLRYISLFLVGAICFAHNMPKKLTLRCPKCKTKEIYLITGLPKFTTKADTQHEKKINAKQRK